MKFLGHPWIKRMPESSEIDYKSWFKILVDSDIMIEKDSYHGVWQIHDELLLWLNQYAKDDWAYEFNLFEFEYAVFYIKDRDLAMRFKLTYG